MPVLALGGAGQPERVFETDPFFSFHHVNAWELPGSSRIVVDTCAMAGGIDFGLSMENGSEAVFQRLAGRASPTRLVLDLDTGKVSTTTEGSCQSCCAASWLLWRACSG